MLKYKVLVSLFAGFLLFTSHLHAETLPTSLSTVPSRTELLLLDEEENRKNTISAELFGRALLYSVNFDRALSSYLTLGVGFSFFQYSFDLPIAAMSSLSFRAFAVPVYGNYYFSSKPGSRFFGTAGLTGVTGQIAGIILPSWAFLPTFGGGFEGVSKNGFLFRAALYGIYNTVFIMPFAGLSVGKML